MGSRFPSHQLSNGLYVSGLPEKPKERTMTVSSAPPPYTGGDIKKSGELGKMFDIPVEGSKSRKSGGTTAVRASYSTSGPISAGIPSSATMKKSGPLSKHGEPIRKSSGPQSGMLTPTSRQNSGHMAPILPVTGLITSGPLNSSGASRNVSGQLDPSGKRAKQQSSSVANNQAVTTLTQDDDFFTKRSFPKCVYWAIFLLFVMGCAAGGFIYGMVHSFILLIVVAVLFCMVSALYLWTSLWGKKVIVDYVSRYPDSELMTAKNGEYVKVSGVVTCGNVPLESTFGKVPRCVYTSTRLYEYRGWNSKPANPAHRRFSWGIRSSERHAVDFYISDIQTGLRALVKTGYGARITPFVEESVVVSANPPNKELSPEFMRWLQERNLSVDDHVMRLSEGYIREGSAVSVMGVVQRNENVLMIVPPPEPFTSECLWNKCMFPARLEGIVLRCEDSPNSNVIAV